MTNVVHTWCRLERFLKTCQTLSSVDIKEAMATLRVVQSKTGKLNLYSWILLYVHTVHAFIVHFLE